MRNRKFGWPMVGVSLKALIKRLGYNQVDYATIDATRCSISAGVERASK